MFGSIQQVTDEFLLACEARGHSPNTIRAYRDALKVFVAFSSSKELTKLDEVTPTLLREYAAHCMAEVSPGAAHARLRPLKTLLRWAHAEEYLTRDVAKRMQLPRLPREPLPAVRPGQLRAMLQAVQTHSRNPLRDRAILSLLYDCGLRASELLGLSLDDIRTEGYVLVRKAKGGKSRTVPIERQTLKALRQYILNERAEDSPHRALFLAYDQPMARVTLDKLLQRTCQFAGLPRLSAHAFRRGFGVQYIRNGGDVFTLQRIFGHTSLEMSNRYAQLVDDDLKAAHRRASPLQSALNSGRYEPSGRE